jgi:predicted Zn-dependent peptidase
MIKFEKIQLSNGLKVIHHKDVSSPVAAFNLLYDVGARDEDPSRTGFAHLFEHLMFGGSANIPDFDLHLQKAGGHNNAFTSNDITNYYMTLPVSNLETAFWLESDRMNLLAFSEKSLEVQRSVVIEEFKQRYLNQPYGDVWLLLRPLCYNTHPYQWATIGKEIKHIEDATMEEVKSFFFKHYTPSNAILAVSGNIEMNDVQSLADKWFGPIEKRKKYIRNLPKESIQTKKRELWVERNVPSDMIFLAFHMDQRTGLDYQVIDLISDLLGRGKSSRFYKNLIKDQSKFIELNAYVMGSVDNGLFVISGKPNKDTSLKEAYNLIWKEIDKVKENTIEKRELQKLKNKIYSTTTFQEMSLLNKSMGLCFNELLGDANEINNEINKYKIIDQVRVNEVARSILKEENCNVLYYKSTQHA